MAREPMSGIVPLDQLPNYEVADGDPDVRGWDVMDAEGRRIGEVDQLLVDAAALKVRYLDVDLDRELLRDDEDNLHVLIPIGVAQLDRDDERVRVSTLPAGDARELPRYTHGPLTRDYEVALRNRFAPGDTAAQADDFYRHDIYDPGRFYS